ncbi:MAG: FAD-binding oxidoreductase, partial [Gammaproteobacteria bacterium]
MTSNHEHCPSYYAATTNQQLDFPALEGDITADVCIIGGGFTGVATALTLAERGYQVVVLEQHKIAWGASGRNGGQLIGGITGEAKLLKQQGEDFAEDLFKLGYRGHEIIEQRIKKYNIDCDYKSGYIDVAFKKRHLKDLDAWQQELTDFGFGEYLRRVDGDELGDILGTDAYLG